MGCSSVPGNYAYHAFIWTKQKGMQDLGTLGGTFAIPHSINNSGHFVGISENSSGQWHAFLWTEENAMQDLGTLGEPISDAYAINESDQVVGGSYYSVPEEGRAFLWDEINGMQDLNDLIPGNSGWVLLWASGINNAGEIVGVGHLNGSDNRAFLLMPAQ